MVLLCARRCPCRTASIDPTRAFYWRFHRPNANRSQRILTSTYSLAHRHWPLDAFLAHPHDLRACLRLLSMAFLHSHFPESGPSKGKRMANRRSRRRCNSFTPVWLSRTIRPYDYNPKLGGFSPQFHRRDITMKCTGAVNAVMARFAR